MQWKRVAPRSMDGNHPSTIFVLPLFFTLVFVLQATTVVRYDLLLVPSISEKLRYVQVLLNNLSSVSIAFCML